MINIFENKRLEEISEDDLDNLVKIGFKENRFIEYKRDMYGGNDEQKTEMLADISAFANAHGGYLLIGIEEDGEGKAQTVVGIEDFNNAAERIRNLCQSSIDEYIQGLSVNPIELANGKGVIVISVPNSPNKPHMITFKSKNRFYTRRDEGKELMNVEEIRDTVINVDQFMRNLEDFYKKRLKDFQNELSGSLGGIACWMILSVSPVFINQNRLDVATNQEIKDLIVNFERKGEEVLETTIQVGNPEVSLNGISCENLENYNRNGRGEYLQVWDNGYIEYGYSMKEFSKSQLVANGEGAEHVKTYRIQNPFVPNRIYSVCHLMNDIWHIFQINEPIIIRLSFMWCKDITLEPPVTKKYWRGEHLIIKPMKYYDNNSPGEYAKDLITKLFRCFGEISPIDANRDMLFDEDDNYKGFKKLSL